MMFSIGTRVKSVRDSKIQGTVIGYGMLSWPASQGIPGDEHPIAVYLVQVARGSSGLGPACAVLRADCVEELP